MSNSNEYSTFLFRAKMLIDDACVCAPDGAKLELQKVLVPSAPTLPQQAHRSMLPHNQQGLASSRSLPRCLDSCGQCCVRLSQSPKAPSAEPSTAKYSTVQCSTAQCTSRDAVPVGGRHRPLEQKPSQQLNLFFLCPLTAKTNLRLP